MTESGHSKLVHQSLAFHSETWLAYMQATSLVSNHTMLIHMQSRPTKQNIEAVQPNQPKHAAHGIYAFVGNCLA